MPVVTLDSAKLSQDQKRVLIEKYTEVTHEVLGTPKQAITVILRESDTDNIGVGGVVLTEIHSKRG